MGDGGCGCAPSAGSLWDATSSASVNVRLRVRDTSIVRRGIVRPCHCQQAQSTIVSEQGGYTAEEQFVPLHGHTEYSMLHGPAKLGPLFSEAARMGMPAIAMTDHGNVFGAYDFYK